MCILMLYGVMLKGIVDITFVNAVSELCLLLQGFVLWSYGNATCSLC